MRRKGSKEGLKQEVEKDGWRQERKEEAEEERRRRGNEDVERVRQGRLLKGN